MSTQPLMQQAAAAAHAGRWPEATALYRAVLTALSQGGRFPTHATAVLNNLGGALEQLGQAADAIDCYRQATALAPAQAVPHYNLGDALFRAGQPAEAVPALRTAATLEPDLQEPWASLGAALLALGQPEAAVGALRRAVSLRPADAISSSRLGDALQSLGRFDESLPNYEQALRCNPSCRVAWYGLGRARLELGQAAAAAAAFERASVGDTFWPAVHDLGKALFQLGCVERAMEQLRAALNGPEDVRARALENLAIIVPGSPADGNRSILQTRRAYGERLPGRSARPPRRARGNGPLRIGYVSSFFHRPNWMKPVWALINRHDRQRVEVYLFSDAPAERVQGYVPDARDRFHDISGQSNEEAAEAIERLGIDLLVDLNSYSAPRRLGLFPLRPAPLQVGWFNLYATSGLDCLDYLIGDEHVIPTAEECFYTERIVRVPNSYLTFQVDHPAPDVAEAPSLRNGQVTIGCLASQYKLTDEVIRTWAEVLGRCPRARLLVRNGTLGYAAHEEHLVRRFAARGIAADRLTLEGPAEHHAFLGTYDRIDFALDPFPYSGGTTTMEALWQGVPVITFDGDRWASRTSVSLLRAAGLGEYVGRDRADYVEICVRLANDAGTPARLRDFRAGIRAQLRASPVCDAESLARSMEALYLRLWEESA
jgi:protein O-GlcNAc transferase